MKTATKAPRITSLDQLNGSIPTVITPDTEVDIDGCYIDWDGNQSPTASGARYTLRDNRTDARIRDLVIG